MRKLKKGVENAVYVRSDSCWMCLCEPGFWGEYRCDPEELESRDEGEDDDGGDDLADEVDAAVGQSFGDSMKAMNAGKPIAHGHDAATVARIERFLKAFAAGLEGADAETRDLQVNTFRRYFLLMGAKKLNAQLTQLERALAADAAEAAKASKAGGGGGGGGGASKPDASEDDAASDGGAIDTDDVRDDDGTRLVPVHFQAKKSGISPEQRKAFATYQKNEKKHCAAAVKAIYTYLTKTLPELYGKEDREMLPKAKRAADLKLLVELQTVIVHAADGEGICELGLQFVSWDDEHGLGVRLREGKIIGVGHAECASADEMDGFDAVE